MIVPDSSTLLLFLTATLAVNLSPGPSMLYVSTRAAAEGRRAGLLSALGLGVGGLVHAVAAALGLSAVLVRSATGFAIVKYLGAAYLIYLGATTLLNTRRRGPGLAPRHVTRSRGGAFVQGVLTDVLNPKIALFFIAFLPQFIGPDTDHPVIQTLLLGTMFCVSGTVVNGALAVSVSSTASGFRLAGSTRCWLRRICGGALIGLGLRLAVTEQH